MNYIKVTAIVAPYDEIVCEIVTAQLGEIGYESFVETETGFDAYIQANTFSQDELNNIVIPFETDSKITFTSEEMEDKNWNEEWEKNYFQPIIIENKCIVRGPFHEPIQGIKYEIVIEPKMSFGTGHHETTGLVMEYILEADIENKKILDMGCGTGILGILCGMRDAHTITGIDIDEWSYKNTIENIQLNNIDNMTVHMGDAALLSSEMSFDIILANINRNILLEDIKHYAKVLADGGEIYFSGFYQHDHEMIQKEAEKYNLHFVSLKEKNNWVAVKYSKSL